MEGKIRGGAPGRESGSMGETACETEITTRGGDGDSDRQTVLHPVSLPQHIRPMFVCLRRERGGE